MRIAAILTIAVLCSLPDSVAAQQWKDQINQQILDSRHVAGWLGSGYTRSHGPYYELIAEDASHSITLQLNAGQAYSFIGKCDNDCRDLDFRLYDSQGAQVALDIETDDYPIVSVTPAQSAAYRLRVIMADCSTPTCGFGVVGFSRSAESAPSSNGSVSGWRGQISRQMESSSLVSSAVGQGFSRSGDLRYGLLASGSSETLTFQLTAGRSYVFIGKCDNDCTDVDFRLADASGNEVDRDILTDDSPIVRVSPGRTQTYSLRVSMPGCSTSTCGYGVMMLQR